LMLFLDIPMFIVLFNQFSESWIHVDPVVKTPNSLNLHQCFLKKHVD
jgi:hypothetical protein